MKFIKVLFLCWFLVAGQGLRAGEGMWIPQLLQQLNEKEMQAMGMQISADDIYSLNHSSMKDAVMLFGRGCTSEVISRQGLLLTNHHCGFSAIQRHSSLDHDYLKDGFWAMNQQEELPNPGLTATVLIKMEEVTRAVLDGVKPDMSEAQRNQKIHENASKLVKAFEAKSPYQAVIKSFFKGNQFYMIVTQTFKDIRLVGAPPSAIGKFGGDTDNWMWPRHTGDFSLFRIYVDRNGNPAPYSKDNVPYRPNYFFPISLKGVHTGDFTFVFGYPARTNEYLPGYAVEQIVNHDNPDRISIRQIRLDLFKKYADRDPKVRIMYASKQAHVANAWKKMIGQNLGVKRVRGIEKKQNFEKQFDQWAHSSPDRQQKYAGLLPAFKTTYAALVPYNHAYYYLYEAGMGMELVAFARRFVRLTELSKESSPNQEAIHNEVASLKRYLPVFYKDYEKSLDQEVMTALLKKYDKDVNFPFKPDFFNRIHQHYKNDYAAFAENVFKRSILVDRSKVEALLSNHRTKSFAKLAKDPAVKMALDFERLQNTVISKKRNQLLLKNDSLMRRYMAAQMEMQKGKRFYPDANFTLRVSYGKAAGYQPADAVEYKTFSTMKGIMEKENPAIYDYAVPEKLKEIYRTRDFGRYADQDGSMHVCFVARNHTSGGNSGSPVLNAKGELIGVNFDRNWEGTMSDFVYDPSICRNISLDIRYFLLIVDKLSGAGYLLDEMKLVDD